MYNFITNDWSGIRRWMGNQVHHALWYREIYSYAVVIECLSGMPIDVEFIDFEDVKRGIDPAIQVIINAGDAGTSWSGAENWVGLERLWSSTIPKSQRRRISISWVN